MSNPQRRLLSSSQRDLNQPTAAHTARLPAALRTPSPLSGTDVRGARGSAPVACGAASLALTAGGGSPAARTTGMTSITLGCPGT